MQLGCQIRPPDRMAVHRSQVASGRDGADAAIPCLDLWFRSPSNAGVPGFRLFGRGTEPAISNLIIAMSGVHATRGGIVPWMVKAQAFEHGSQALAERRELVLYPGRHFGVGGASHDAISFEPSQPAG